MFDELLLCACRVLTFEVPQHTQEASGTHLQVHIYVDPYQI